MHKIFSSLTSVEIHNLKNVLEARGIECEIRGESLRTGLGELPVNECWTELWIVDDSRIDEAKRILSGADHPTGAPWNCPQCGESVEAQFGQCWNCQAERREDDR